jgi:hypothetical protein
MNFVRSACFLLAVPALLAGCGKNFTAYALTSTGSIIQFDTKNPSNIENTATVTGLASGESVTAMAYDPGGQLYCITDDGYICTLNPQTGVAAIVGTQFVDTTASGVTWSSPVIAVDPTLSDVRVITSNYNLLVAESGGTPIDDGTKLAYDSSDTNNGKSPVPMGIAYTNPFSGATSTTLYVLDSATGSLAYVGSTNVDSAAVGNGGDLHTVGSTGVSFLQTGGFAIEQQSGDAYAALQPSGTGASLYTIDLSNGSAGDVGVIGDGTESLIALAIPPGQ